MLTRMMKVGSQGGAEMSPVALQGEGRGFEAHAGFLAEIHLLLWVGERGTLRGHTDF